MYTHTHVRTYICCLLKWLTYVSVEIIYLSRLSLSFFLVPLQCDLLTIVNRTIHYLNHILSPMYRIQTAPYLCVRAVFYKQNLYEIILFIFYFIQYTYIRWYVSIFFFVYKDTIRILQLTPDLCLFFYLFDKVLVYHAHIYIHNVHSFQFKYIFFVFRWDI